MLQSLPAYVAGRTVPGAIKLASNETPFSLLPAVVERLSEVAVDANRYPDPSCAQLTEALAAKHSVDPSNVAVGVGSVALCQQLTQIAATLDNEVIFGWRAFEAYPIMVAISGATAVRVPLLEYTHDLPAMAQAVTERTRLIFVCNPNNPTGTAVGRDEVTAFLDNVPNDVLVVIDEAYREFVTDPDVPDGLTLLSEHDNLVVLRTFSKAYGLAGLRVGYAVAADPAVTRALRQVQLPFGVTQVAQAAAVASLEPAAEKQLMARVDEVVAERARVRKGLLSAGYSVPPTQSNFVWVPLGDATASWADAMADHGLIVRPFVGEGARVTVGTHAENDRFLAAAAEVAAQFG